jgi:uncharacterized protein (TIGR02145 family)
VGEYVVAFLLKNPIPIGIGFFVLEWFFIFFKLWFINIYICNYLTITTMKKVYTSAFYILIAFAVLLSCSKDENTTDEPDDNVTIGRQVWMKKNLDVDHYRNGDPIPHVTDPTQWVSLTTGAWCYYENNTANGTTYGKLYNWYAVNDARGLAPAGYHVPTDDEWTILTTFLGGESVAGNKMKATTGWTAFSGITNTNSSGFTGLPGGYRYANGTFNDFGYDGYWWSSSEYGTTFAWTRVLDYEGSNAYRVGSFKLAGSSVRCLRD